MYYDYNIFGENTNLDVIIDLKSNFVNIFIRRVTVNSIFL